MTAEYDPLGRRTAKTVNGVRTQYIYDGQQVVQELNAAGVVQREYIWGNGIDELVAIRQDGTTYYAHQDNIGSMVAITDQNGALVERYTYDEFGKPYFVREMAPPCVSTVTKQSNVLTVDFCATVSTLVAEPGDISVTTIANEVVPFTFTTSADALTITITDPVPSSDMRLVVFGVEGDDTVIAERIERTFSATTEGQLDSGGASFPVSVIVENSTINNTYLFQGREWEPELGLYYFRARYYDPSLGRFLQHDPLQYSDSPNLYQAFLNNPANYTDPMGTDVGALQAVPDLLPQELDYLAGYDNGDPIGRMAFENRDRFFSDGFYPFVHSYDSSECIGKGYDFRTQFNCTSNVLQGGDLLQNGVSWQEADVFAGYIARKNFPGTSFASADQIEFAQGIVSAKPGVDLAGHGLITFLSTVAPGTLASQFGSLNTLQIPNKLILGNVAPPTGFMPGTSGFGNAMHERIVDWLQTQLPDSELLTRIRPGQKGIDVTIGPNSTSRPWWQHAEIKPNTVSGRAKLQKQLSSKGWQQYSNDRILVLTYDSEGNIYLGFVQPKPKGSFPWLKRPPRVKSKSTVRR
jgi:RHS repeat-associated protein